MDNGQAGRVVEWKAVATFPVTFRGKMSDQAFAPVGATGDVEVARRAIGDWVTRTLDAAPVGTRVEVVECREVVVDTYTKSEASGSKS